MAISLVQQNSGIDGNAGAGSVSATYASTPTAGNMLFAAIGIGGDTSHISSFSDTNSNTWTKVCDYSDGSSDGVQVWVAYNCKAGATTVSFSDGGYAAAMVVGEVAGVATSWAFDKALTTKVLGSAPSFGPTSTLNSANEFVLAIAASSGGTSASAAAYTVGSGYSNFVSKEGQYVNLGVQSKVVSATSAVSANFAAGGSSIYYNATAILTFSDTSTPPPTVALNSPSSGGTVTSTTPQLKFTGTAPSGGDITYEVDIDSGSATNLSNAAGAIGPSDITTAANSGDVYVGESFIAPSDMIVTSIEVVTAEINFGGTSPTSWVASLFNTTTSGSAKIPTGSALATSASKSTGLTDTTVDVFTFSGSNLIRLTSGTNYAFAVVFTGASGGGSEMLGLADDQNGSTGAYTNGNAFTSGDGGATFTTSTKDVAFKINYISLTSLVDALSITDAGFSDITNGADSDPFASGDQIGYTVQPANSLSGGATYYWRVRGKDPSGTNAWGDWSVSQSFSVQAGSPGQFFALF